MKFLRLILNHWRLLLSAFTAGAIIHIWTTLTTVPSEDSPAYQQLVAELPVNKIAYLPEVTPETQKLPFMMPDVRYAICPFDATNGPIRINAAIPAPGWSLSLHTPNGENFLYVQGTDDRATNVNILLRAPGTVIEAKNISEIQPSRQTPEFKLTHAIGVAIYSAPIGAFAYRRMADEQLNSFRCQATTRRS